MKQKQTLRATLVALSASIVLPTAPVSGQETAPPVVAPPSPVTTTTPPPRIVVTPPAAQRPALAPAPRVTLPPVPEVRAPATAPEASRTATRTTRAAPRARAAAPRATAAPAADAADAASPAPVAELPATALASAPPVAPVSALSPATGATGEAAEPAGPSLFGLIAGLAGLAVIALITFLALRRRRTDEEVYYEETALVAEPAPVAVAPAPEPADYQEPLIAPAPTFAREPAPARDVIAPTVSAADEADVAALAASSDAGGERPWLEFLLRPVRAGTSRDETIVQYDLTIANTGGKDAREVRVTSWLFPAGTSEMEQSLIDGPTEARAAEADIAAGEGVRIEGEASLAKAGLSDETVLPVLVAEARYRLPDGREGRTRAAFEIGMSADGEIAPFPIDRATGLVEFVEARLHGEPERV